MDVPRAARDVEDRVAALAVTAPLERLIECGDTGKGEPRARVAEHHGAHRLEEARDARLDHRVVEIADDAERLGADGDADRRLARDVALSVAPGSQQPHVGLAPVVVALQRRREVHPLAEESLVVRNDLALVIPEPHPHARARQGVAVDALVRVDEVAPERVGRRRRGDVARLDDTSVHEHARPVAVAAIRRDLVRPIVVADADRLAGTLDLGAQLVGDPAEARSPARRRVVGHRYGTSGCGATATRPIMFASPPNQICRDALSNVMWRIVFALSAAMAMFSVNFRCAGSNATRRFGCGPVSASQMRPRSSAVTAYGIEPGPLGSAYSSIRPLLGSSRPRKPRV